MLILISFMLLTKQSYLTALKCEKDRDIDFRRGSFFIISEREHIVSTIYDDIDIFIDAVDGIVSASIRKSGTWQPEKLRTMARFVK